MDPAPDRDELNPTVAPGTGPAEPLISEPTSVPSGPPLWQWAAGLTTLVVATAIVGGLLFRVPYVALVPGTARDTEPLVEVEGLDSYPSDGELLLTTVRVRQRPNFWEYVWLRLDDDVEVVPEEVILGNRTPEENRQFNLALMNDSKSVAIAVALEELGYDAVSSDGVVIVEIVPGSAADGVLDPGDVVTAIDDEPVETTSDLVEILGDYEPGDEITLTVDELEPFTSVEPDPEDGQAVDDQEELEVVLGAKEDEPDSAFLGVQPADRIELADDFDFVVDIDTGAVGGPSAGLAFTLAVLDQLTPGELTGGLVVAVTGTIDANGRVGSVGGVVQKAAAVREMGADVFIVPATLPPEELETVIDRAGDSLQVIPVHSLEEALEALAELGGEVSAVEEFAAANLS